VFLRKETGDLPRWKTQSNLWLLSDPVPSHRMLSVHHATRVFAGDFTGKVVGVIDGDSIRVMHNGKAEQIRLNGIDCSEKRQAFGRRAKQATSSMLFGKAVTIKPKTQDRYGRTAAEVDFRTVSASTGHWSKRDGAGDLRSRRRKTKN
jgi:endonuclease YncB( thermonuclease family)